MSKYSALWGYVQKKGSQSFQLTFEEIQEIAGIPIDQSFLKYKKELMEYGYEVGEISMKGQTVDFHKLECKLDGKLKRELVCEPNSKLECELKCGPNGKLECKLECRLLLFDLDGTLLRGDKTISERTLAALRRCREKGMLIGVSTSRGEQNALSFIEKLQPDILIASGGALVKQKGEYIYKAEFSAEETRKMIAAARKICGDECEITIDTVNAHYWNYKVDPKKQDQSWGESIYTDFADFRESSLKMCVEIPDENQAGCLKAQLADCDCIRFSSGFWYKFTKKEATKEKAIMEVCAACGIRKEEITAFGDDYADIGMLELCGKGIAMGNAINAVKEKADLVIGSNEEDGIAEYLEKEFGV